MQLKFLFAWTLATWATSRGPNFNHCNHNWVSNSSFRAQTAFRKMISFRNWCTLLSSSVFTAASTACFVRIINRCSRNYKTVTKKLVLAHFRNFFFNLIINRLLHKHRLFSFGIKLHKIELTLSGNPIPDDVALPVVLLTR